MLSHPVTFWEIIKIHLLNGEKMNHSLQIEQSEVGAVSAQEIGFEIVSFYKNDNTPILSDIHLSQIFRRIVREETLHDTFYDGSVINTKDFVEFVKNKRHEMYFVKYHEEDAGFFWITQFTHKASFVNYCLYEKFWGKKALIISNECINFILERKNSKGEYILDVILGLTPTTNKLAINFLIKNGMTVLGKIPGILYDYRANTSIDGLFSYKQRNGKAKLHIQSLFFGLVNLV